jgi:hypothetical protein
MLRSDSLPDFALVIRSEVSEEVWRHVNAHSVQECGEIDNFLCDGPTDWRQVSECGGEHSQNTQGHPADGGLKSDAAHAPSNMNKFVYSGEGSLQDYYIGCLGRNVALHSKGDADCCRLHRRSVINAVPKEQCRSLAGLVASDGNLLFRAFGRMYFLDSDLVGEVWLANCYFVSLAQA